MAFEDEEASGGGKIEKSVSEVRCSKMKFGVNFIFGRCETVCTAKIDVASRIEGGEEGILEFIFFYFLLIFCDKKEYIS